jgi:hypothetical protein
MWISGPFGPKRVVLMQRNHWSFWTEIGGPFAPKSAQKTGDRASAQKYFNYAGKLGGAAGPAGSKHAKNKSVDISIFGGFTTVSMGKINSLLSQNVSPGETVGLLGPGFIVGAGGGFAIIPGLYVGPRFEYIGASARTTYTGGDWGQYAGNIIPLLIGATYDYPLPGMTIDLCGQLYLGYGFAGFSITSSVSSDSPPLGGGALVVEIGAKANYRFSDSISAGLMLGYRLANVSQIALTKDYQGAKAGDVWKDDNGTPIQVDFSGFTIAPAVNFSF